MDGLITTCPMVEGLRKGIVVFDINFQILHVGIVAKFIISFVIVVRNVSFSVSRLTDGGGLKKSYSISLMVVAGKRLNFNSFLTIEVKKRGEVFLCVVGKKVNCSSCPIVVIKRKNKEVL